MIKHFGLRNFKAFRDTGEIEIKPITILAGANSSGKSSIIQSLLLLKQSLESDKHEVIDLEGRYLQASGLNDLTFGKPGRSSSRIGLHFNIESSEYASEAQISRYFPRAIVKGKGKRNKIMADIGIEIRYGKSGEERRKLVVSKFDLQTRISGACGPGLELSYRGARHRYRLKGEGLENLDMYKIGSKQKIVYFHFYRFTPSQYYVTTDGAGEYKFIEDIFENLFFELRQNIRELKYLGPLREEPSRAYLRLGGASEEVGIRGEYAAQILWIKKNDEVDYLSEFGGKVKKTPLLDAVRMVFQNMGILNRLDVESSKNIMYQILFRIAEKPRGKSVTIADVGFGISQLLPVVVMGLISSPGTTLIYEQPEIHLHPKLQSSLADFLITLGLTGKRVIVETHSEYLINRIRRRIVEDSKDTIRNMTNILFLRPPSQNKEARIEFLKIDKYGIIKNWPEDFLPEAADEAAIIVRKGVEKRANA